MTCTIPGGRLAAMMHIGTKRRSGNELSLHSMTLAGVPRVGTYDVCDEISVC